MHIRFPLFYKVTGCLLIVITFVFSDDIDITNLTGVYSGQTVFNFLTIPVSAVQLGHGAIALPESMDATDVPFAAAATAFLSRNEFAITHMEWLMGLRKEYIGAAFPLLDQGALGFYSQLFTYGDFDYAFDIDEYPSSDPTAVEIAVGASYSRQLIHSKLSAGLTASYIESRLASEGARAFNAAVDIVCKPLLGLSSHLYARNLGTTVRYNETEEQQPFQGGLSVQLSPFAIRDTADIRSFDVSFALGAQKTIDAPLLLGFTTDFKPMVFLSFRAGYEYRYGNEDISLEGLSGGFSLNVKQYGIDGGWKYQSKDFGSAWALSVRYNTAEIVPKTAMDYYTIAEKFFKRDKFRSCLMYARKALSLNPNLWQAHSLIARTISEMNQRKGMEVAVIYTGNTQGEFLPIEVNNVSMGGLARQAAVIRQLRSHYPLSITLDAGTMITKQSPAVKAQFAEHYYRSLNYDAVGIGIGELEFGFRRYCAEAGKPPVTYICSNCSNKVGDCFIDTKIINVDRYRIALLCVVPGQYSLKKAKDTTLFARTMEIIRNSQDPLISMCHLRILIANDSWENVQHYAQQIPLVDVILCGSIEQQFETPMTIGSTPIISTGSQGKYVGALELRFNKDKKLLSYKNRLFPLTDKVNPDASIDLLVQQIAISAEMHKHGLSLQALKNKKTDGLFAFTSDRRGGPHVYLNVMDKQTEFPLTFGTTRCSKPIISYGLGKIIYLAENDTLKHTALMIMDINGANKRELDLGGSVKEALFGPDTAWIYAAVAPKNFKQTDIYRISPQGGKPEPVITWKDCSEYDISFSSDGVNMLFTSDRDGKRQIYISDNEGNIPVRITDDPSNNYNPGFSPLDDNIAYLSEKNGFNGRLDLWIHEVASGKKVRATRDADVHSFLWLDDKGGILYSSGATLVDLNTLNIFTGENKKLITGVTLKDYSETYPALILYKEQKRILYTKLFPSGNKKLFLVDLDGSGDQQISVDKGNCWTD